MKQRRAAQQIKELPVKTTFMELIQELSNLTDDDNLVVAAVKNILRSYNVRAIRSLAPVRLADTASPRRSPVSRRRSCWA
ncbi:MAG TPA: hypothetical protein VFU31_20330 [Candidatus Binatia bacterium]|nr:hypothetical protein [Candidatus Binatia bacterium]